LTSSKGWHGTLSLTFAEGTSAAWLDDLLKPHVSRLVVCDPRKAALWKEGNQSDRIEARKLAELLRTNQLQALGGLATDFLFLVMNERGARSILSSKVRIRVMCLHLRGRSDATPRPNLGVYLRTLILT
jgi:hypothetical protein